MWMKVEGIRSIERKGQVMMLSPANELSLPLGTRMEYH
jgi:hypothetical protein